MAKLEYGDPTNWGDNSPLAILNTVAPYFNIIKRCDDNTKSCCQSGWMDEYNRPKIRLADGSCIAIWAPNTPGCNLNYGSTQALSHVCGDFNVKLSGGGYAGFHLSQFGIIPFGSPQDTRYPKEPTAWIILKENFDYPKNGPIWE